jgi:hypothetical protein
MRSLESAVLAEARTVFKNRKLRLLDIMEWTTGDLKPKDGEVITVLPMLKITVAIQRMDDKRPHVWVLEWRVYYEPGHIHGVFTTKAGAEAAQADWKKTERRQPDDWNITEHVVES